VATTYPFYTAEAWLRGKAVSKSPSTHIKYSHTVESFLTHLGTRARTNVAAIGSKEIASFRDAQINSGKHPNTVRYLVKQLRIPFNAARRQGIIHTTPPKPLNFRPGQRTKMEAKRRATFSHPSKLKFY
jgi:hypothetical protein